MPVIGERLATLRSAAGLTQRELAERAEVSVDLVSKLEQGRKHTARITSLTKLARALDADLGSLVSGPRPLEAPSDDVGVLAIRRALTPAIVHEPDGNDQAAVLADTWAAYWRGDFNTLGAILPAMIANTTDPTQRAEVLNITASLLAHLGHQDLAHVAATASIDSAGNAPDPLLRMAMGTTLAWALIVAGRPEDGASIAADLADEVEPSSLSKATPAQVSTWGNIVIKLAASSARCGDSDRARDALRLASAASAALGVDREDYHSPFGPALVAMQHVDIEIQLGDPAAALKAARTFPRGGRLPLAARARHLSDVALAHTQLGHDHEAEETLLKVERDAPEWIAHQGLPCAIVAELIERERRVRTPNLRGLAHRLGVTA